MHSMLTVTIGNNIYWRYVSRLNSATDAQIYLQVKWFTPKQLQQASEIILEYRNDDNNTVAQPIHFIIYEDDVFCFEPYGTPLVLSDEDDKSLILEYSSVLSLKFIKQDDKLLYAQKVVLENSASGNSLATRMKKAIQNEAPESRNVLRFMLELNNKLDDIISMLKGSQQESGSRSLQTVGISETGFILHDELLIPDGSLAYTTCMVGDGDDRITFSTLLEISQIKSAKTGYFYMAEFVNLKQDIVDGIVKYMFSREREMITGVREL